MQFPFGFHMAQVPACPGGRIYVIRPGDTFYALAQRFGTTVDAIARANPGVVPQQLRVGQRICIPVAAPAPPPPAPGPPGCPGGRFYIIRPGDTFYALARRFGTTVDAIARANPGVVPQQLRVGQRICIPVAAPAPPPAAPIPRPPRPPRWPRPPRRPRRPS
ncbi:MAG: LysM peptidoglycan-binding domain-containing protein [Firmicutes bacterium]|nr:LysM peptidoglycan-binding domain-containing protein [Bacillota bacterium]